MAEAMLTSEATPRDEAIIFTEFQKDQLWGVGKKITTVCWFLLVAWYEDRETVLLYDETTPKEKIHAEIIALNSMKKSLEENKSLLDKSKVIDIKFWMNNSPCLKCQERIILDLQQLKVIFPNAKIRFIIFFSSFFKRPNDFETCMENLNVFFKNLFLMDITVIAGLILVTKTVPEPKLNEKQRKKIEKREKKTLRLFLLLFTNVNTRLIIKEQEYITIPSLNMLEDVKDKILPFENPHFAICRSDSQYLAPLILILGKHFLYNSIYKQQIDKNYLFILPVSVIGTLKDLHFEEQEQQDEEQENSDRRDEEIRLAPSSPPT